MSMRKRMIGAGWIAVVLALSTGCTSGKNTDNGVEGTAQPEASPVTVTPQPAAAGTASASPAATAAMLPAGSVPLIPEVEEYSGSGREFEIAGTLVRAGFSADQELPLGLFLPETMIRFGQEGRTAWGTADKLNYITFVHVKGTEAEAAEPSFKPGTDQALLKYKEYLGTSSGPGHPVEAFRFIAMGEEYRAELTVTAAERAAILPVLVQMLSQVEHMEKRTPIVPGVFLQEPDVGEDPGNRQALQETMSCIEAWVAKDKDKFAATMHSLGINEALQFLLDGKNVYRINELTLLGIPIEGTKRAGFTVGYEQMTSEGYITKGTYEISLLRNKQGEWKIANID
ncbi:hypothetical protein [Paenibacillus sp. MMS20-IR301]|uniref:hypothetical protein n=1 Tax=Paenibacillus sp. MMS20-IR301 TaxID=2895946 RepID=UPI0028E76D99|nr:hypothetical protein [Paenibacillus sp. MMS20-IR301]WNS45037.1 hypothetical protein LOS79_07150 [Paenibacillus sp. MMS20-IR301]